MNKYDVVIVETVTYTISVEAESEDQAEELANEDVDDWGVEPSSNLPPDDIERQVCSVTKKE